MKRTGVIILIILLMFLLLSCNTPAEPIGTPAYDLQPKIAEMEEICELAVMDCYYRNVAKYTKEDAEGFWFWEKDLHFWIEYMGIVRIGINVNNVYIQVNENKIKIALPKAEVLDCDLDETSMKYYVDDDSAKIHAEDEKEALAQAQAHMAQEVANNHELMENARSRVQEMLENYINNIGDLMGIEYEIEWQYVETK